MSDDLFDTILNLEDESYDHGYQLGVADGSRAGRIEGRVFGLEKGFEKFVEAGRLHGRACVWGARFTAGESAANSLRITQTEERTVTSVDGEQHDAEQSVMMARLPPNQRLEKHIHTLYALVEPETLSTQNNEDAVSDFDDRFKRAVSKVKVIENILGEQAVDASKDTDTTDKKKPAQTTPKMRLSRTTEQGEKNIEDFGLRPSRP
jgi:hypothetical protein